MGGRQPGRTLAELAAAIERAAAGKLTATVVGDAGRTIEGVAPLDTAGPSDLTFLANLRYRRAAETTRAGAIVLTADAHASLRTAASAVLCAQPYAWFALAAQVLHPEPDVQAGIAASATLAPDANIGAGCRIDANAVVEGEARIGAGCWIGAGCYVGRGASIGDGSRLYPGARVLAGCAVGARCIVHSGAVIGADGFGFAPLAGRWIKIPQIGRAIVGDDVEIGANTTIDRGTMGDTVIEDGVKIDNQVQIAHNCRIGAHTVIAGCVGVAGSAKIGRRCQLGGAAMIHGHIEICDDVIVSGGTLISRSITEPGFYSGVFPFMPNREWERNAALVRHLRELRERIRALEARIGGHGDKEQP
ncbi:MAG TPA: UDP-3-O-(3-hydroxymyristoyl)glucosamine N-acyltransferase [Burkholderiaceae bacterium]|nr:UDP-3-O-(3-hydroxymyristoyl)glucosamine N-acyltransferase [Burkholderiaceae bacterium]